MSLIIEIRCLKHPKYRAIRKPKCDCFACRRMWLAKQEPRVPQAFPDGSKILYQISSQ